MDKYKNLKVIVFILCYSIYSIYLFLKLKVSMQQKLIASVFFLYLEFAALQRNHSYHI